MPVAEGKTFDFENEDSIKSDFLESFAYDGKPQKIKYETEEFSAVCPFSGLPDISKIIIEYIPDSKIVELKSLKYYFISYRNVGIYQEAATSRIYSDLEKCLNPKYLSVTTEYNIRGGILSTCVIDTNIVRDNK